MNETQASEASRSLLARAWRIAQVYAARPNARAIILTGSAAEGVSGHYSDLDIILFKRMHRFVAQLDIAPPDCADRLESLFHADGASAAEQARELTREIVALVDEHMPQVDTSRAHARIDFQQQVWKP